ncbi:hypothetical protein [Rhodococcus triatomae]
MRLMRVKVTFCREAPWVVWLKVAFVRLMRVKVTFSREGWGWARRI